MKKPKLKFVERPSELRLDLGAGKGATTPEGFDRIDIHAGPSTTVVDLRQRWPWRAESVDEVRCHYLLHYLTAAERVHFFNELYRVLKPGAQAQIATPHWCANRAYLDLKVQWPPVSEGFYHTLNRGWREAQNCQDESGLTCNFEASLGYGMHPMIVPRNSDFQQQAVAFSKEAAQDLICTVSKV